MEKGRSSYKDAINYGRTYKNAGEYCETIKNSIRHYLFCENKKIVIFAWKNPCGIKIYNIFNKTAMPKSKSQFEVCFFCCINRCRSPPASDLNLPPKNKFESEE